MALREKQGQKGREGETERGGGGYREKQRRKAQQQQFGGASCQDTAVDLKVALTVCTRSERHNLPTGKVIGTRRDQASVAAKHKNRREE